MGAKRRRRSERHVLVARHGSAEVHAVAAGRWRGDVRRPELLFPSCGEVTKRGLQDGELAGTDSESAVMVEDVARTVWYALQIGQPDEIAPDDVAKLHYRYTHVYGQ